MEIHLTGAILVEGTLAATAEFVRRLRGLSWATMELRLEERLQGIAEQSILWRFPEFAAEFEEIPASNDLGPVAKARPGFLEHVSCGFRGASATSEKTRPWIFGTCISWI